MHFANFTRNKCFWGWKSRNKFAFTWIYELATMRQFNYTAEYEHMIRIGTLILHMYPNKTIRKYRGIDDVGRQIYPGN